MGEGLEEGLQKGADLVEADSIFVNFAELRHKHITDLQADALRTETVAKQLIEHLLQPCHCVVLIACLLDEKQYLGEQVTQQGQEFVDSEVINLIPMLIQDVDGSLEPLTFVLEVFYLLHYFTDFHRCFALVDRFIGVPKHYKRDQINQKARSYNFVARFSLTEEKTLPNYSQVLLLSRLLLFDPSLLLDEHSGQLFKALVSHVLL